MSFSHALCGWPIHMCCTCYSVHACRYDELLTNCDFIMASCWYQGITFSKTLCFLLESSPVLISSPSVSSSSDSGASLFRLSLLLVGLLIISSSGSTLALLSLHCLPVLMNPVTVWDPCSVDLVTMSSVASIVEMY